MTVSRKGRWRSFSLRSLLLAVVVLAAILGRWTNSAIEQRKAVATIRDHYPHNRCEYDYERQRAPYAIDFSGFSQPGEPDSWVPKSVQDMLGKDYFYNIDSVVFGEGRDPKPSFEEDRQAWKALSGIGNLRQLTSYIEPLDEDLAHISRLRNLKMIDLQTTPQLTDDALRSLGRLRQLERLTLSGGHYTANGFKQLTGLRDLKHLRLLSWHTSHPRAEPLVTWLESERAIEVTDEDLAQIGKLIGLEDLRLASTRLTDAGLAHLSALTNLKTLELAATNITAAGFEHLSTLQNLEQVKLYCPRLSDDSFHTIAKWRQLRLLELYRTTIDGSGFQHLTADSEIDSVFIFEGPNITDDAIPQIARLANLKQLQLHCTQVTAAGLERLQAAPKLTSLCVTPVPPGDLTRLRPSLPKCSILRVGRTDL